MHYSKVSTNYAWLPWNTDPNVPTPEEYEGMAVQPLGDKQSFYEDVSKSKLIFDVSNMKLDTYAHIVDSPRMLRILWQERKKVSRKRKGSDYNDPTTAQGHVQLHQTWIH